jgi:transcriptional regulator with XRE-family HTH domain
MPVRRPRPTVDEAFGRVLAELRHAKGLSQEQLGNESGSGRTFISELERGKRGASLKTIFRLAPCLEVSPSEIIGLVERECG